MVVLHGNKDFKLLQLVSQLDNNIIKKKREISCVGLNKLPTCSMPQLLLDLPAYFSEVGRVAWQCFNCIFPPQKCWLSQTTEDLSRDVLTNVKDTPCIESVFLLFLLSSNDLNQNLSCFANCFYYFNLCSVLEWSGRRKEWQQTSIQD